MTYVRVWRFRPLRNAEAAFESAYGPEGDWARLFGTAKGYDAFRQERAAEFVALDRHCETLTALEKEIGSYDEVSG